MSKKLTGVSTIRLAVLTPWFPGSMVPARVGVYQRDIFKDSTSYSRWDGQDWYAYSGNPSAAALMQTVSAIHSARWRGLAEQPK
jgi:hypothetical protein